MGAAEDPTWPVFCIDGRDVIVVHRAVDLPVELDPVLADQPVQLIDSSGRRLKKVLSVSEPRRWFRLESAPEIIGVEVVDGCDDSELLRQELFEYLVSASVPDVASVDDLATLVRSAVEHVR